ncbi:intein C-terminal splicing domain protein [Leptospira noguchii str. 2001034031]|uniref:Intein C-terminal splicing domain protein n=2 Tax=Leptospira noguchii TaxID=28182 RepID=M6YH34_9LEPT|nr:intein C-terminal splicing domain protein [Leptospira noguchii str. 2001034031]
MKELSLGTKMDKPLFTQAEIDKALPKDEHGNIDMDKADPEKLLEKWNAHKEAMSQTPDGLKKWKDEVSRAGERSGIEIKFNEGKSATSTFGKFVSGLVGDVAQSFGFANDGSKMVDKNGVFHLDTCFAGDTSVRTETGLKSIEDVKIGDVVRSWNENTNLFENKTVTELFVHEVPQLFFLELDGEEELHTTWNHPFRRRIAGNSVATLAGSSNDLRGVQREFETHAHVMNPSRSVVSLVGSSASSRNAGSDSEWVKVEDLRLKDQVLKSDGSWGTVTGVYYYNTEPTKVYNLEVEDNHTYVVGGENSSNVGYVVHNYAISLKEAILSSTEVAKAHGKKEVELKWGEKIYTKTSREGETVFERDYDGKGTKEYIRVTKDGLIEQRIKWNGQFGDFMAGQLSGEKIKHFNTRGEEVQLQPAKIVRDGGSQKLPFDPVDTKIANAAIERVKGDYEKQLRADYANNKKLKLTPEQIETRIKADVEVYNRVADRTFKNSYVDKNGNPIPFGSDEFLKKLASPEFNGQNKTDRPDGMEGPVKVVIEYMRAKHPDGKGYVPNLAPWNEKIAGHKENLKNLNANLEANRNNPELSDKAKATFEKEMAKKMEVETKALHSEESARRKRMEEFQKSAALIFGKGANGEYAVSSDVIAKQTKAAICRVDTNYLQSRANGRMEASFGDYLLNKIEMGDIRPGTDQKKGLVWDNAHLKGYENTYPRKDDIDGSSFNAANAYTGEPLKYEYIQEITAGMKPGQVYQVWTDTDSYGNPDRVSSTPGPNHYYEFGMNQAGQLVYYNHTEQPVKYFDANGKPRLLEFGQPIPKEAWPYLRVFRVYK